jgi:hypothetical protein
MAVAGQEVGQRLVTPAGREEVVMGLVDEHARVIRRVGRPGDRGVEVNVGALEFSCPLRRHHPRETGQRILVEDGQQPGGVLNLQ